MIRRAHAVASALLVIGGFTTVPAHGAGEPPRPLTERGLDNLVAFSRLLGYVRHFHPSDQVEGTDWDAFAIAAVDTVESAGTPRQLAGVLRRLFQPIAPALRVETHPAPADPTALLPVGTRPVALIRWQHHGYGGGIQDQSMFWSRRAREPLPPRSRSLPSLDPPIEADLGGGVWCSVPVCLYADALGTLPRASAPAWRPARARPPGFRPTGLDRATRLADVALFWNVAQHFYPYFDVVQTDWPAALREGLRRAATDPDALAFLDTLRRLVARLHDGHGDVSYVAGGSPGALPWDWIEGRLVITGADSTPTAGLRPGHIVRSIDGLSVDERLAAIEPLVSSATPQWLRYRSLGMLAYGPASDSISLGLADGTGRERTIRLPRRLISAPEVEARPGRIARLRPGVYYVDVARVGDDDFEAALDTLAAARGIVFDFRGYPYRLSKSALGHLSDSPLRSPRWGVPLIFHPDHREMAFEFSDWTVPPQEPRLGARKAFIIDGRAISAAETYLAIVERYRLGELVGGPTAGTNGNVITLALPGDYLPRFTGLRVLKHDGGRHHGVGVLPTVPVARTLAGVAAGRDELLEKAIEVVTR